MWGNFDQTMYLDGSTVLAIAGFRGFRIIALDRSPRSFGIASGFTNHAAFTSFCHNGSRVGPIQLNTLMKKWIFRIAAIVVVLLIVAVVAAAIFMGSIIKKGVETVGPTITKTEMKLDSANVSILSGSGSLKGFLLGNPQGYTTPQAIKVGKVELGVKPGSVFSDKVHVTHIRVESPDITLETQGVNFMANNLNSILANVQAAAGDSGKTKEQSKESGASKKLQVDEFLITGAKVNISSTLLGGKPASVTLPEIRLQNLGSGPDGVTAAELTDIVMQKLVPAVLAASQQAIGDISKQASELIKDATGGGTNILDKAKGIGDLFKKKN